MFSHTDERDDFDAVIIRTDYRDDQVWEAVKAALKVRPFDDVDYTSGIWIVDDPTWAGVSVDEALAAVNSSEALKGLEVFFLADEVTMQAAHHALIAVTTTTLDEPSSDEPMNCDRVFRTVPEGVRSIHANLELANMGFEEFSAVAHHDPEDIYRP
ncbi:DUF6924 domain-containing protein [Streptomyces sp. NPDC088354]|uniref:DUF6924 domain-containing protein n=1 Tax=Streptomyces sp. NPDC088354 TaxID=3365856 RepID=UPI0038254ADD